MASTTPEILPRTFIHVPGVGRVTEKALWDRDITSWRALLSGATRVPFPLFSHKKIQQFLEKSEEALLKEAVAFFAEHLPPHEWWRLYPNFKSRAVFLDIETTGLSRYYDEVTLVGLFDGTGVQTFIAGHNLERLPQSLNQYDILVTFNGTTFDIPFLKAKFPTLRLPPVHLDLRYLLRRLGLSGGLKAIEQRLGMTRPRDIQAIDGVMATVLWARYLRGDIGALEQLIRYNTSDITSLTSLAEYSSRRLTSDLLNGTHPCASIRRPQPPRPIAVAVTTSNGSAVNPVPRLHSRGIGAFPFGDDAHSSPPSPRTFLKVRGSQAGLLWYGVKLAIGRQNVFLKAREAERPLVTIEALLANMPDGQRPPRVVGIDLRAAEDRTTGWALLVGETAQTRLLKTDEEILQETIRSIPAIISIDSPLGLPLGRCCVQDTCDCREKGILRECERILWRRGVRVFPCLLPSMQKLTERGIRLAKAFRKRGYAVIESYPGAAQDIMRIPRKRASLEDLAGGLSSFGIKGSFQSRQTTHDELDAITSAVVAYFYLTGDYEALGNKREECLIIPKLDRLLARIIHDRFYCNRGYAAATVGLAAQSVNRLHESASLPRGSTRRSRDASARFRHEPS